MRFGIALFAGISIVSMGAHLITFMSFYEKTLEIRKAIEWLEANPMYAETHLPYGDHVYYIKKGTR